MATIAVVMADTNTTETQNNKKKEETTPNQFHNLPQWLIDNKHQFKPPVCNYLMHGAGQLKVMFVGGPNIRKDFHLEEGEEFFYMVKGDMNLIVMEHGQFKDVIIKEGEVFQLPGKVLHSPQRQGDTMGLVIERERMKEEMDCVRYFVGDSTDTLYEEWFYCSDLGTQLGPVIKRYFASEQHKTGKPLPGSITATPPFVVDNVRTLDKPFHLLTWIQDNMAKIQQDGRLRLFSKQYQSDIEAMGAGSEKREAGEETWLWQIVGTSTVTIEGKEARQLSSQDSVLIEAHEEYTHVRPAGSVCLSIIMSWATKERAFMHLKSKID